MNHVLATEKFSDTSMLLTEMAPLADQAVVALGWNSSNMPALLPAWKTGTAIIVTDRNAGMLTGVAVVLRFPSAIHESDAMVMLMVPSEGRAAQLVNYCRMAAKAHGANGLALSLPVQAPLAFLDVLSQQGFTTKAMTLGVRL
jgi:hypothetical protein